MNIIPIHSTNHSVERLEMGNLLPILVSLTLKRTKYVVNEAKQKMYAKKETWKIEEPASNKINVIHSFLLMLILM